MKVKIDNNYLSFFIYLNGDLMKLSELENKDVVNITNGKNIGRIIDIKIDREKGTILSVVLDPYKINKSFFGKSEELEIPWTNINKIGDDVILITLL